MATRPRHDWYLPDWMATLGVHQAKLVNLTGFTKTKVSFLFNGHQGYTREIVNTIADALHIQPFELLMHPDDAMRLRRYRETAVELATAEPRTEFGVQPPARAATG